MLKIDIEEDDRETKELDRKVEEVLKEIAKFTATAPQDLVALLDSLAKKYPNANWPELFKRGYEELPKITTVLENWTSSLSAYATYRALKRQERLSEKILASNRILAFSTAFLALATFALVLVTVLR
jgi:hypothetical protein